MLKTLLLIAFALMASGCLPDGFESSSPSAGVDVTPAKGGGGTIEPAEIPINERDEFADDCECGCGESSCNCSESPKSSTPPKQEARCQTWTQGGHLYWMADGVQWYLETGGTLGEGQAVQGGRFVMRNGTIIDRQAMPQQTRSRRDADCVDGY